MRGPSDPHYGEAAAFDGGEVIDGMTQHQDLYPTICDVIGAERPEGLDGKSVMPLVRGEMAEIHEAIFSESRNHR
jgi:arylsulfatase A-like enzyme